MIDPEMQVVISRPQWAATFVPQRFKDVTFDSLKAYHGIGSDRHLDAVHAADAYAQDARAGAAHPLVLYGPPGTGKTLLAACVWHLA